jgi:hypothetical protein
VPEQPLPETLHVTLVLLVPVTVALNCCVFPSRRFCRAGETVTTIAGGGGGGAELPPPPQAAQIAATATVRLEIFTLRRDLSRLLGHPLTDTNSVNFEIPCTL